MPIPRSERQETERLLREQLARIEKAETGPGRSHLALASGLAEMAPSAGWPAIRLPVTQWRRQIRDVIRERIGAWTAAMFKPLKSMRLPGRKPDRLAELQARLDGLRSELQHDEPPKARRSAFSGVPYPTARQQGRSAFPAVPAVDAGDSNPNLRNGSGRGSRFAAMTDAPVQNWGPPPTVQFPRPQKKKDRRGDLVIAALGVVLGLTCALFPWYIFFNQEQFGVQAIALGGRGHNAGRIMIDPRTGGDLAAAATQEMKKNLDLFSTATLQTKPETPENAPSLADQPFPSEATEFRLVHVANGRAMIEDNAGLWVVQPGSMLPDSTRVKSIEKREGRWVLVTSADRVVELSK